MGAGATVDVGFAVAIAIGATADVGSAVTVAIGATVGVAGVVEIAVGSTVDSRIGWRESAELPELQLVMANNAKYITIPKTFRTVDCLRKRNRVGIRDHLSIERWN